MSLELMLLQLHKRGIKMECKKNIMVIAAVRSEDEFEHALSSDCEIIFDLKREAEGFLP